jgi:hypothetical protein
MDGAGLDGEIVTLPRKLSLIPQWRSRTVTISLPPGALCSVILTFAPFSIPEPMSKVFPYWSGRTTFRVCRRYRPREDRRAYIPGPLRDILPLRVGPELYLFDPGLGQSRRYRSSFAKSWLWFTVGQPTRHAPELGEKLPSRGRPSFPKTRGGLATSIPALRTERRPKRGRRHHR